MLKLNLKQQLFAAFTGLALFVLIIGAIGAVGVNVLGGVFHQYQSVSQDSLQVNGMKVDLATARGAAFNWRTTNNASKAEEFSALISQFISSAEAQNQTELADQARSYREAFEAARQSQAERDRHYAVMAEHGPVVRQNITDLMESAYADNATEDSFYAGRAQEKLMLGRFYAERYINSSREDYALETTTELQASLEALTTLLPRVENPQRRALTTEAIGRVELYISSFNGVLSATRARNQAMNRMDELGPDMATGSENARLAIIARQEELGGSGEQTLTTTQTVVIGASVIAVLLALIAAFLIATRMSGSLRAITEAMRTLAAGDKSVHIEGAERSDEIGEMAQALVVFRDQAVEMERMEAEQAELKARTEADRRAEMMQMANAFEAQVGAVIEALSSAANDLGDRSITLNGAVDAAGQRSTSVASAAEQASGSVEAVASAAEELTASIREVSSQVASSAEAARASNSQASKSGEQLDRLNTAVAGVDEILGSINDVAEQTNLLALNATIEAARAGEAGRGFAVVASEVKALAAQTQKLTEEIGKRLSEIRVTSGDAITSTRDIIGRIQEIDSTTQALAAAVEEQTSATGEISSSAQQAADGARTVSEDIAGVQTAVNESASVAEAVNTSARLLLENAESLRTEVSRFLNTVRAA
ncbi:methyl-accepting chemotaxis protein [Oceanicaulis sp. LC35]|uniref:methyl-accepting chemotaxis protein n=1 Tax=Oceanicaulis sp. LC35 TaxID=3349635 RepID=UPI003F85E558